MVIVWVTGPLAVQVNVVTGAPVSPNVPLAAVQPNIRASPSGSVADTDTFTEPPTATVAGAPVYDVIRGQPLNPPPTLMTPVVPVARHCMMTVMKAISFAITSTRPEPLQVVCPSADAAVIVTRLPAPAGIPPTWT